MYVKDKKNDLLSDNNVTCYNVKIYNAKTLF